jgi:hypothetical protein
MSTRPRGVAAVIVFALLAAVPQAREGMPAGPGESPALTPPHSKGPASQAQPSPAAQRPVDGFEPISEIPASEQLPAAPMVVAAYIFVLLAFFAYVLSIAKRLGGVKQEMARLESELKRSGRS